MTSLARPISAAVAVASAVLLALTFAPGAVAGSRPGTTPPGGADTCSAPVGLACAFDVAYGSGPNQTLDVYWSTLNRGEPSVILIHGGGWMAGTSRDYYPQAVYFAQNGFAVFSLNYTLSTEGHPDWPQVYADVEAAAGWVSANASAYGADGSRIASVGGSAGGHLAALMDTAGPEDGHPMLATVSWSGPMDLPISYRDGNDYVHYAIEQLLGCAPGSCDGGQDVDASPISHVTGDDGALLFFNSDRELVPVSDQRAMRRVLKQAHVPHRLVVFKNSTAHANEYECWDATVLGQTYPVIDDTLRWLGKYLNGRPLTPTGTYCP